MKFGHHICAYEEEIVQALSKLVAIPSVCGEAEPGLPYGKSSAKALACILSMAEEMGFSTRNVENYAGHAEYSCGKEGLAAVLAHVDVVPAGMGWDTDPFTLTRKGNLLFGRGVVDDKGAAIVALYCLKALKDHGVTGKRSIRAIFGAGEEVGMEDLKVYFQQESLPDLAFTPDSDYGICNREKGILHGDFSCGNDSTVVQSFMAGSVVNAVPDRTTAVLRCSPEEFAVLQKNSREMEGEFLFEESPDGGKVVSKGVASHAMCPEEGKNSAAYLLRLLATVFSPQQMGTLLSFLQQKIGIELDGESLGIKQKDAPSGPLTLNLGIVRLDREDALAQIDIRFPVTGDSETIVSALRTQAEEAGIQFQVSTLNLPLYFPEDAPLVGILENAYESVMGEKPALYATGGGTYARAVSGRCVAFGPVFPDEPDRRMHNSNEHIDLERFMLHAQICLEAMYRMITEG